MNRKLFFFILSILIFFGPSDVSAGFAEKELTELSKNIENKIKDANIKKIAILEFVNSRGDLPNVGNYIRNNLFDNFSESKDINIMLNRIINDLLKKQEITISSSVNEKFIIDILGVDAVVSGIITDFPEKIKINTKLTLKGGKLLAVYVTEIMKNEKGKPLLDRIIQSGAYKESSKNASNIFLSENFNTYKPNSVPEDYDPGFIIVQAGDKYFISSNLMGDRKLIWKIDFPDNFTFSFSFLLRSKNGRMECSLIFIDEDKNEFVSKFRAGSGQSEYLLFPGSAKAVVYFSDTNLNKIRFEKKKDIYKIFLNDKETAFGIYSSFKKFKKVILQTDFRQGIFTDFQGIDLGR